MEFRRPAHIEGDLARIREFVERELIPLEPDFLLGRLSALAPVLQEKRRRVKELGLWAPHLPREWGGMGLTLLEFAFVSEELGRTPLGHHAFHCAAPDVGNMEILMLHGTGEQKERWLRPLAAGEIRSCFSMTEPDYPGSNPAWMGTTAVKDGGDYVLQGRKWFTTGAEGAAFAIVMAVTNPEAQSPYLRASQIIVPTDTPGFRLVRNIPVMGEQGTGPASHGEIAYEGCRVPQSNRLGPEGAGFVIAQERLGPGRIHHCMRWIGICERALDLLCRHAVHRLIAPGRPLGTRQTVQTWIAESRAEIDAARLLVLRAAWRIDAEGAPAARDDISLIKFFAAGVLQRTLDRAIQALGGLGVTDDTPLAWWWRHERGARIYDGPDEVHQAAVARHILAGYGLGRSRE
jgi:alkylation response protein AidB-like acyl-CoA dehydrogenase